MELQQKAGPRWGWFLQRASALLLVIGLFAHFWVLHYALEKPVNFDKVAARLQSPEWVIFDVLLLGIALYHGLNGIWNIIMDYAPKAGTKRGVSFVLWLFGIVAFTFGAYALIPFKTL